MRKLSRDHLCHFDVGSLQPGCYFGNGEDLVSVIGVFQVLTEDLGYVQRPIHYRRSDFLLHISTIVSISV